VSRYEDLRRAVAGERLPCAIVDLDALDANCARFRAGKKAVRIATKSIRSPELIKLIADRVGAVGLMTYSATETAYLASQGWTDLLMAYPTVRKADVESLAASGSKLVVDSAEQLVDPRVPVVIDVDMSLRVAGAHVGVRRSPLHSVEAVVDLAREIERRGFKLAGLMGYEAQIAGVTDAGPFGAWMNGPKRAMKLASRRHVERLRRQLAGALRPKLFNGGGSGSASWADAEDALTEITVGSAFLGGHLFDYYKDLRVTPAAYFALQVTRRPAEGFVTCHGGGWIASGEPGPDRLPLPALPEGLKLLGLEGAGEVQTPLRVPDGVSLQLGDPVFFRHAKSGELAEHVNELVLIRGDRIEGRAKTYRGLGHAFL
jgi:D-serine deaminase-like pyridoxal phosphate-dependent protein